MPKGENVEFFANIELNTCLDQRKQIFISPVGINQVSSVQLSIWVHYPKEIKGVDLISLLDNAPTR